MVVPKGPEGGALCKAENPVFLCSGSQETLQGEEEEWRCESAFVTLGLYLLYQRSFWKKIV